MRIDVSQLMSFYDSRLGGVTKRMVNEKLDALWPNVEGMDVLGIGYPIPFLSHLDGEARRCIAAMPAQQGGHPWPVSGRGSTTLLTGDERLPFPDAMFDRILVVHGLEEAEQSARYMREIWRVCAPEGRVVMVVSSRRGVWSRAESTPFGHGRPFTRRQLTSLMSDALFQTTAWRHALYGPPVQWGLIATAAEAWERAGELFWPQLGGVLMIEGIKRLYIDPTNTAPARIISPFPKPVLSPRQNGQASGFSTDD